MRGQLWCLAVLLSSAAAWAEPAYKETFDGELLRLLSRACVRRAVSAAARTTAVDVRTARLPARRSESELTHALLA